MINLDHSLWQGPIESIRIDPIINSSKVHIDIDEIRLIKE